MNIFKLQLVITYYENESIQQKSLTVEDFPCNAAVNWQLSIASKCLGPPQGPKLVFFLEILGAN